MSTPKTSDIHCLIDKRYPAPEYVTMHEVAPRTGGGTRYADAVAIGLWQSRGHAVHGFEVKVSRADWLRELKKPEKTEESVFEYCDFWWIVAPAGIVRDGELPPTWGLLEAQPARLVQKAGAPKLSPNPITRAFFAALIRRGFERIDAMAKKSVSDEIKRHQEIFDQRVEECVKLRTQHFDRMAKKIKEFEAATGLDFTHDYQYPPGDIIAMAKQLHVLKGYGESSFCRLDNLAGELEKSAAIVRKAIEQTGLGAQGGAE